LDLSKVCRRIVADKPRVTRFPINWAGDVKGSSESQTGEMRDDEEDVAMEEDEGTTEGASGSERPVQAFSSPLKPESSTCFQNVVSPEKTCINDAIMGM
jgi:hypothetical protein